MKPYYQDEWATIYHGDCREVLPAISGFDLVVTSPPYNLGITTGGGFASKFVRNHGNYSDKARLGKARGGCGKWSGGALADGYGTHDDAMPWEEYEEWQRGVLLDLWRGLADSGAIYYNHKPRAQRCEVWLPTALNPGLPLRQIVTWYRAGGINFAPTHYVPMYEWILVFAKPDFRLRDKGASGVGDVWYIPQQARTEHPAPFPIGLPARAISTTSASLILDPFMGSGTTLRAAKDLGRKSIGIEIEEKYCEIAAKRLAQGVLWEAS